MAKVTRSRDEERAGSRILVVDDAESIRTYLANFLQLKGYEVDTAEDGVAGLEAVRARAPDLVVLDVMMPGKDGFEVVRELRAFSRVPVVMLTARGDELDRIVGLELGSYDYLANPFNPR